MQSSSRPLSGEYLYTKSYHRKTNIILSVSNTNYRYYENGSEDFDFHSVDVCLAGLGTGLLSTAAVSLSPTLADVPLTGAHVLRVAFRLGILVNEVSQNLQSRQVSAEGSSSDSWAYVVSEISVDEVQRELDAIHFIEVRMNTHS